MELSRIIELTSGKVLPANNIRLLKVGFCCFALTNYCSIMFHIFLILLSTLKLYLVYSALDRVSSASVTMSHLIAYDPERDLLPLILAHCNYSLEVGQETLVHYDWAALERQLIDRFLRGRPFVEFKVSC